MKKDQVQLKTEALRNYSFLQEMRNDSYFPPKQVEKGISILVELCLEIEEKKPANLEELYHLTH